MAVLIPGTKGWASICLVLSVMIASTFGFTAPTTRTSLRFLSPAHQHCKISTGSGSTSCRPQRIHKRDNWNPRQSQGGYTSCRLLASVAAAPIASNPVAAWWFMSLLALQFACQPLLTKTFATTKLVRTTYVVAQDVLRFVVCALLLTVTSSWSAVAGQWSVSSSLVGAGLPASLYAIQNYCSLMAYQNLSPISYNVLNQTKTLSAAFFCYILLGMSQSKLQVVSLLLLLVSALVMEQVLPIRFLTTKLKQSTNTNSMLEEKADEPTTATTTKMNMQTTHFTKGVLPIILASLISGLAGTLSQQSLQQLGRHPLLFSMEISVFSSLFLLVSLVTGNPDGKSIGIRGQGITRGWTLKTWIPLCVNVVGSILVGLVTKYAGSVRKGFALVVGLLLSGILQNILRRGEDQDGAVSLEQWAGGILAGVAIWMHVSFPTN